MLWQAVWLDSWRPVTPSLIRQWATWLVAWQKKPRIAQRTLMEQDLAPVQMLGGHHKGMGLQEGRLLQIKDSLAGHRTKR